MADEKEHGISIVKSILVYPIKSCRGIYVPQASITSTSTLICVIRLLFEFLKDNWTYLSKGFKWDRQWLIVNSKGRAYTQRVEPKLALVQVFLADEEFYEDWQPNNNSFLEVRPMDPNYAHGYKVMFADGYPFLLISQGLPKALTALLQEPVPINRFRPNILVDGCFSFFEDLWTKI